MRRSLRLYFLAAAVVFAVPQNEASAGGALENGVKVIVKKYGPSVLKRLSRKGTAEAVKHSTSEWDVPALAEDASRATQQQKNLAASSRPSTVTNAKADGTLSTPNLREGLSKTMGKSFMEGTAKGAGMLVGGGTAFVATEVYQDANCKKQKGVRKSDSYACRVADSIVRRKH